MKKAGSRLRVLMALFLSFLLTGLYFFAVYQNLPFIYDINDDVAMRNVAAGVITGTPDAHLLHIKYLLGLVISGLYKTLPGLDWYGLVLIGIMLFAFSMVLYRGLAAEKGLIWKAAYTAAAFLLFTCTGVQHITAFQWTVAASMAGAAGIYLFYTSRTEERFQMILEEGIAIFLILTSLLIRDDVFLMTVPVAALCFWWKYGSFEKSGKWPLTLHHLWVPAALLTGTVLILGVEAFAYRDPAWREFRSYNVDREAIMDYYGLENYDEDPEFFDSLGITPEEAENMQRYSLYLVDDLYSAKMKALAERSREVYLREHSVKERLTTAVWEIYRHLGKDTYHPVNLICLAVLGGVLGLCVGRNRRQLGLVLSVLAVVGVYWLYLGYRDRMIERAGFALYLLTMLTLLAVWYRTLFLEQASSPEEGPWQGRILTAAVLVILTFTAGFTWSSVKDKNTWRRDYNLEFLDVNRYMAEHMENVYFMTTFSIETYTDNFSIRRDFDFSNLLSVGGWHTFSPLENEKDEKLGITDPRRDIVEKDDVYVISLEDINLRYMDRYYTSLYGDSYRGRELVDRLVYGERVFEVYDFMAGGKED